MDGTEKKNYESKFLMPENPRRKNSSAPVFIIFFSNFYWYLFNIFRFIRILAEDQRRGFQTEVNYICTRNQETNTTGMMEEHEWREMRAEMENEWHGRKYDLCQYFCNSNFKMK